jgi:hypothetical protein
MEELNMKKAWILPLLALETLACSGVFGQGDPIDQNSVKRDHYDVVLSSAFGSGLDPGDGVDMSDPYNPHRAPFAPFHSPVQQSVAARQMSSDDITSGIISATSSYYDDLTIEDEAHLLSTNFKASYMFTSASAAYQRTQQSRKTGRAVYFIYTIGGQSAPVEPSNIKWTNTDLSGINKVVDRNLMLRQFLANFGSHYVTSVQYGARISIRAQMNTLDEAKQQSLSGKIQAAFGALSGGGSLSTADSQALSSQGISITAEIASGGIVPSRALVMTSFDEIASFLSDFRAGKVRLLSGPISAELQSYWSTIDSATFPNIYDALAPSTIPASPPAPFGVPAGTIVAWFPKAGDIVQVGNENKILAPIGWLICDGTQGTPDLQDKWLAGTVKPSEIRTSLGSDTHIHEVKGTTNSGDGFLPWNQPAPGHQFQTQGGQTFTQKYSFHTWSETGSSIPPSIKVVFIMKE